MTQQKYFPWAFGLSLAGVLFAGYLAGHKLIIKTCAFGESCPAFLGQPACYFGFALFLALAIDSGIGLYGKVEARRAAAVKVNSLVSLAGVLFAGYLTIGEIIPWFTTGVKLYNLGLPTCSYGLVFFVAVFVLSALTLRRTTPKPPAPTAPPQA